MTNRKAAIRAAINEIYEIASELSIASDKTMQGYGQKLRKVAEQLETQLAAEKE